MFVEQDRGSAVRSAGAPFGYANPEQDVKQHYVEHYYDRLRLKEQSGSAKRSCKALPKGAAAPAPERLPRIVDRDALLAALDMPEMVCDCPLPGYIHNGLADLECRNGELRFVCNCYSRHPSGSWWYWRPPEDVYYALFTNRLLLPREGVRHRFVWRLLLTHRLRLLKPEPVDLPELASDWPEHQGARDLFALLMGLKRANGDHRPMPFPERLVADYLGVKRPVGTDAVHELRGSGVIHRAGMDRRTPLYVPGDSTPDPTLKDIKEMT